MATVPAGAQGETGEGPAAPEAQGDDARRFFDAAQKAFAEGRYTEAAHNFQKAFDLKPHPAPLINAGDAWDKAGEYALAARAFTEVLELDNATEQDRIDATDRLARISPKLGVIELVGNPKLRARIDKEEFRGGDEIYLFPGEHVVTLVDVDGAKSRTVQLAAGTKRSVDLSTLFPKKEQGSGSTEGASGGGSDPTQDSAGGEAGISTLTWAAYGVGALGLVGTVVFGLQVNSAESSYNDNPNQSDLDSFNQAKLLTNLSLGVAVVGAGVGTFFLLQDLGKGSQDQATRPRAQRAHRRARSTDFGVLASDDGGLVYARGRF